MCKEKSGLKPSEHDVSVAIHAHTVPPLADIDLDGFSVQPYYKSGEVCGSDFYDVISDSNKGLVCFVLGDVSGKGISASCMMVMTKMQCKIAFKDNSDPSTILESVNNALYSVFSDTSEYVTLSIGVLNIYTGVFSYASAGHVSPLLIQEEKGLLSLETADNLVLGFDPNFVYVSDHCVLTPQDKVLFFNDGLSNAENKKKESYGNTQFESVISKFNKHQTLEACYTDIETSLKAHIEGVSLEDDISFMLLNWKPKKMKIEKDLRVNFVNNIEEVRKLEQVIRLYSEANSLSLTIQNNLNLVLEELLSNTIFYGYEDHAEHIIYLELHLEKDRLIAILEDDGKVFNPLEDTPEVDIELSLEDVEVGGLGVHFVKTLMDDIHYERKNERNIITMIKKMEG